MTFDCNKDHIAIIYGSQPCPLCASHARIVKLERCIAKACKRAKGPDWDAEGALDDVLIILKKGARRD